MNVQSKASQSKRTSNTLTSCSTTANSRGCDHLAFPRTDRPCASHDSLTSWIRDFLARDLSEKKQRERKVKKLNEYFKYEIQPCLDWISKQRSKRRGIQRCNRVRLNMNSGEKTIHSESESQSECSKLPSLRMFEARAHERKHTYKKQITRGTTGKDSWMFFSHICA